MAVKQNPSVAVILSPIGSNQRATGMCNKIHMYKRITLPYKCMAYLESDHEHAAWSHASDPKYRLETALIAHHPQPCRRPTSTKDEPYTILDLFVESTPHEVIVTRPRPPSPMVHSSKKQLLKIINATNIALSSTPEPMVPSLYRSLSPDTICCGLITVEKPVEVYA